MDYICGCGSLYFKNNLLYNEQNSKGVDYITAHNGKAYEKAELTFSTYKRLEMPTPHAVVIEDVEGFTWLMGYHERPFPIFEFTDSLGFPGEPKKIEYVVTFISEKSLILVG